VERVIPLEGGFNFRDLGGYETRDGRHVRWRQVFRSGAMSSLTARDDSLVQGLGIRVICDLRTLRERQREAVRWAGSEVLRLEWDYDPRHISLGNLESAARLSQQAATDEVLTFYRRLPSLFEQQYAGLFAQLAAGNMPLVFGCSAGKDRTGLAAALLLTCLGVRPEQVLADYALTDQVVDLEATLSRASSGSLGFGEDHSYILKMTAEARAPLLKASPEYLEGAFDQIRRDHGSVEAYLRSRLGVSDDAAASIRAHLLEDAP
jgi:protein-tyrosine phosphatase